MSTTVKTRLTADQIAIKEKFPHRFDRDTAVEYGKQVHSIPWGKSRYARAVCEGDGPPYRKVGRVPIYDQDGFDEWAAEKLGLPATSTREHLQNRELLEG